MTEEFNLSAEHMRARDFDELYQGTPPWEIGRPQPVFARLCDDGALQGHVLDVGCGTGEHALLAAEQGLPATGVDAAPKAIELAKDKARQRGLDVRFVVGDALDLPALGEMYDTVIDSAVFHVFGDDKRPTYVDALHHVVRPGGRYFMLCFSEKVPGTVGPRRVSEAEIRDSFAQGWTVDSVQPVEMETTTVLVSAYLASITRI